MYTFNIACMLVHVFKCIQSPIYLHRLRQPIDWCSINCSHASIHAHTPHHVHKSLYTLMFFLLWQTCSIHVHIYFRLCLHVFTACMFMYSLHVFNPCKYQYLSIVFDNRSTDVPLIVPMFSVHACSCIHCMHVRVFTPCFQCVQSPT